MDTGNLASYPLAVLRIETRPTNMLSSPFDCHGVLPKCTVGQITVENRVWKDSNGHHCKRNAIHLTVSKFSDCKTLLVSDAPLGVNIGYKDLFDKGGTDQRSYKTKNEDYIIQNSASYQIMSIC
jgi:hypothetical protein